LKFSLIPRISFIPKEGKFFDLFEESARNVVKTANLFAEMIEKWDDVPAKARQIKELEHQGDDISHLTEHLDDVADCIEDAASCMALYEVVRPTKRAYEFAAIIVKISNKVSEAVPLIRNRKELSKLPDHCIEINRLENEGDAVFRAALAELFHEKIDVAEVIKWREIYHYMEAATDRCEDIANVLEGIMIKRT
jgi:uncharacterized protein Yka (UPF0111/DUF47 family)